MEVCELRASSKQVVLIAIGTEMTTGQFSDTNSTWLAKRLLEIGIPTVEILIVPDELQRIREAFVLGSKKASLIISTGGLGSTHDDLTRQALGQAIQLHWEHDPDAVQRLETLYREWGFHEIPIEAYNQVLYPKQGTKIENPRGTALGFYVHHDDRLFVCLPGIPHEMSTMFTQTIRPLLELTFPHTSSLLVADWMCYGTTEENVSCLIQPFLHTDFQVVILVDKGMIRLQVSVTEESLNRSKEELMSILCLMRQAIDEWCYGENGETVEQAFVRKNANLSLMIIDESTGGMCSALLKMASPDFPVQCIVGNSFDFDPTLTSQSDFSDPTLMILTTDSQKTAHLRSTKVEYRTASGSRGHMVQIPSHYENFTERLSRYILFLELQHNRKKKDDPSNNRL